MRSTSGFTGAAAGKIVFTAEDAKRLVKENKKERVILVRLETSPEDIEGMHARQESLPCAAE